MKKIILNLLRGNNAGFSMLELLLYSAIVGILVSIAVPKYNNAVALANTAKVQADLQSINTAIAMYQAENGEYPGKLSDLSDYVMNIDKLEAPSGAIFLKGSGITSALSDSEYGLSDDKDEATYGGHTVDDFGNKSAAAAST